MPADSSRAVFLSYASQDAEAAKSICDALRATGVEVWFDQNELGGGDAWDAKIRRQISECALFVPMISAATQARREGYFRLEWRLAAQRTHMMSEQVAFLLPIVIDATHDAGADVPTEFKAVQWTRLPTGEGSAAFCARVKKLLSAETPSVAAGVANPSPSTSRGPTPERAGPVANRRTHGWLVAGISGAVMLAALAVWRPWREMEKPAVSAVASGASRPTVTAEFPRRPELKRARALIFAMDSIAVDFALADDLVKPLLTAQPNDPEIVTVAAEVSVEYLTRGFDQTLPRRAQAQQLAERAVQLAPDNPAALAALGRYLRSGQSQLGRAEELLRRAIALDPKEPRYHRYLYAVLIATQPGPEAEAFGAQMVALFPNDPLVAYEIAMLHMTGGHLAAAEESFDRTLKLAPLANALTWKAKFMLEVHGDVEGMKLWLDRVPDRQRTNARVAQVYTVAALITGQTASARHVLDSITDTWLADGTYIFPKAMLVGDLEAIDRHDDVARLSYEAALDEIHRTQRKDPTDLRPQRAELAVQLALGHQEEALAALRINLQKRPNPYRWNINLMWWSSSLRACLLLGERAEALTQLREACAEAQGRLLLRNLFRVDPKMAPFRDDPEIAALLAEPSAKAAAK